MNARGTLVASLGLWGALLAPGCGDKPSRKVDLVEPSETISYVDASIALRAFVTGESAASVDLLADGALLANLGSSYEYVWDTRAVPEGEHHVVAQARYADGSTETSPPRFVVVDHQPLAIAERTPAPSTGTALPHLEASLTTTRDFLPPAAPITAVFRVNGLDRPATVETKERRFVARLQDPVPIRSTVMVLWTGALVDRVGHQLDLSQERWSFQVPAGFQRIDLFDSYSSSLAAGAKLAVVDGSSIRVYDGAALETVIGPLRAAVSVRSVSSGAMYAAVSAIGDTIWVGRFDAQLTGLDAWTDVLSRPQDSSGVWFPGLAAEKDGGVAVTWQRHAADAGFEYDVVQWSSGAWEKLAPREGNYWSIEMLAGHVVTLGIEGLASWSSSGWTPLSQPDRLYELVRDPLGRLAGVQFTSAGVVVQHLDVAGWVSDGPALSRPSVIVQARLAFDAIGRPVLAIQGASFQYEVWRLDPWGWSAVGELDLHGVPGVGGQVSVATLLDGRTAATVLTSDSSSDFHTAVFLELQ